MVVMLLLLLLLVRHFHRGLRVEAMARRLLGLCREQHLGRLGSFCRSFNMETREMRPDFSSSGIVWLGLCMRPLRTALRLLLLLRRGHFEGCRGILSCQVSWEHLRMGMWMGMGMGMVVVWREQNGLRKAMDERMGSRSRNNACGCMLVVLSKRCVLRERQLWRFLMMELRLVGVICE